MIEYTNRLLGGMVGNESSWCVVKELTYVQTTNDVFDLGEQTPFFPEGGLSMLQRMSNGSGRYAYTRHS